MSFSSCFLTYSAPQSDLKRYEIQSIRRFELGQALADLTGAFSRLRWREGELLIGGAQVRLFLPAFSTPLVEAAESQVIGRA
jgi:hypothetical protein